MRVIGILLIATTAANALSSSSSSTIDNTDVSNNGVVGLDEVYRRHAGKLHEQSYLIVSLI